MIYTSYYSNKSHKLLKMTRVSVSRFTYSKVDFKMLTLAPTKEMLINKTVRVDYNTILTSLNLDEVVNRLKEIESITGDCVLLCFEEKGKFCHRHLLREFLNKETELNIQEF